MSMKKQYGEPKDNYHLKIMLKSAGVFVVCVLLTLICLVPIYLIVVNASRASDDIAAKPALFWFEGSLVDNWNMLNGNIDGFVEEINAKVGTINEETGKEFAQGQADAEIRAIENVAHAYSNLFNLVKGYLNSLIIAGCTTLLTVFFSAMTAYGLTVYDFRLRGAAYTFIIAVMMIPVQVSSAGFVRFMYQLNLINNFIPLIIPAIAAPAVVFFMKSYMKSSFPLDIVEAARIDGCGEYRTFMTIALPMMKPAMAVQAIFAFVSNWNNYYTQNMILKNAELATIPIMISKVLGLDRYYDYGVNYMCIVLSIMPIVIIYFVLSKFIIAGVALGGVKE